ncbi:uracil-DNA glycosylase [Anaeromicrobium sediminis]|uniref:Type-4 uracil-DNA glycosylase n=1 Tax=Anaeromicrobium sediminis TaxID=1478221 RepID=A0A267MHR3_9FIRM|nr:uracil-DNA glycosylase [Anaeromicrobium sediminis]PAB58415.1 uracil-DNA glycosylase [Anaeromicrobium sediminis]
MKEIQLEELNKKILEENKDEEIVLGNGSVNSTIVLIGEAPGAKEVEAKLPFVGQAGKHLQEFLEILELDRSELYITNTVKFRPTKESPKTGGKINRPPSKKEIGEFKEYLFDEINIIKPKVIVTLGNVPLKTVTGDESSKIGDLHGKESKVIINGKEYNLFPLYHPAAVIYRRELKEVYYGDLEVLKKFLV